MAGRTRKQVTWWPQHIKGANAQWDPLAGVGAFTAAWALEHRVLFLTTAIQPVDAVVEEDAGTMGVGGLIAGLMMMDATEPGRPITLYINSPGGDIRAGLALIQTMRSLRSPVHTCVLMEASSMAACVSVAGAKRLAYPTARWLLHRGKESFGRELDWEEAGIAADELKLIDKTADQVLLNFTKIRTDQLEQMQRKDFFLGTREALRWGLIDEVMTLRQGPDARKWLPHGGKGRTVSGVDISSGGA